MESVNDRRVKRTKTLLTNSLAVLMADKKIKDITVKELCELADINRGTFYLHYKDIFHMLESVEQELLDQMQHIFEKYHSESSDDFPYPLFLEIFQLVDRNSDICRVLLGPNGDISFIMKVRMLFRNQCIESWVRLYSPALMPHYEYFSNFIIYGCAGIMENWLMNKEDSPETMAHLVTKLVSTGVTSLL